VVFCCAVSVEGCEQWWIIYRATCFPTYPFFSLFPYLSFPLLIFSLKNRPAPFPDRMLYKATKPGFRLIWNLILCCITFFGWWMRAFVVLGLVFFPYQAIGLGIVLGLVFYVPSQEIGLETSLKWPILCRVAHKTHTHTQPFNGPFLGLSRWAGTRKVKPVWILLKQETVGGSGWSAWFGFIVVCLQVNVFECPVCGHANCLTCKAQHEGSTCRDYQDSLRRRAAVDVAAKKTQKKIEV